MNYEWGGPGVPEWDPPPALPPRPGRDPAPQVPPRRDLELERADWYWGNISREEASEQLSGQPDGTFLVRDSHTASGEYTLCLSKDGSNRTIRIYCRDGWYGFSDELCQFDSVVQLIDHYRRESLRDYNVQLDLRLQVPLVETRQYGDSYSNSSLIDQLQDTHKMYDEMACKLEWLDKRSCTLADSIVIQRKAQKAYRKVFHVLKEQVKLAERIKAELHEQDQLLVNKRLLDKRVEQVRQYRLKIEEDIHGQSTALRKTEHDLSVIHQEERRLLQQKHNLERELLHRGVTGERLKKLLGGCAGGADGAECTPLSEQEELWLLEGCNRSRAEAVLRDKPDGTFLIRPRNKLHDMYVLSIMSLGQVRHCLIERSDRGYGFSKPYAIHSSLKSLVDHYAENELGDFNEKLPTPLLYPALGILPPA